MFCPICKAEYKEGIYVCADCRVTLAPELPDEPESVEEEPIVDEFIEVFSTMMYSDISLIRSILDAEDISYFFQGEFSHEMDAGNPMKLLVKADQAERVEAILHQIGLATTE